MTGETAQDIQMLLKLIQIDMVGKTISVFKSDECFSLAYLITFTISPSCLDPRGSEETCCELLCLSEIMSFAAFRQVMLFSLNVACCLEGALYSCEGSARSIAVLSLSSRAEAERPLLWLAPCYHSSF